MNRTHFHQLYNATLQALHNLGDSGTNQEIHDQAITILDLSDDEINELHKPEHSNQTKLSYRLAWARTWLKRYGLLENSTRGVWSLTAKGKSSEKVDGKELDRVVNEMLKKEKQEASVSQVAVSDIPDGELPDVEDAEGQDEWREALYGVLLNMDPVAFERTVPKDSA